MAVHSRPKDGKRRAKRDPVPLGIGDFTTPEMLSGLARIGFLGAVQREVPQVLVHLAEGPLQSARESVDEIANWAVKFNLVVHGKPAEWVTRIAQKTISSW